MAIRQIDASHEVCRVERHSFSQSFKALVAGPLGEMPVVLNNRQMLPKKSHIQPEVDLGIDSGLLAVRDDDHHTQVFPQAGKTAAQVGEGAGLARFGPEGGRQGLAAVGLPGHSQVSQQSHALTSARRDRFFVLSYSRGSEEVDVQGRHV